MGMSKGSDLGRRSKVSSILCIGRVATPRLAKDFLALSARVNAHDHGQGIRQLAFGYAITSWSFGACSVRDPPVDPYPNDVVALVASPEQGLHAQRSRPRIRRPSWH
jgi:hypothetical protein